MSNELIDITPEETFEDKAKRLLSIPDNNMLVAYIEAGKHPLAPETASNFYGLFLTGNSVGEIHRLNKAFPYESILWAAIKYDWHQKRDEYALELQSQTAQKVMHAQLETAGLMSDLLIASTKKHGARIKKYLQSGNEADLGDGLSIDSLQNLMRIAESLQKVTGQANTVKVKTENVNTQNVNVSLTSDGKSMDADTAAAILKVVAESRKGK
jgi:hypothetical protein